MTTSKKKRKCLLACARKGYTLQITNLHLKKQCLDPVNTLEWNLWINYYVDIVRNDPYLEHELIDNNRSLSWLNNQIHSRHKKQALS